MSLRQISLAVLGLCCFQSVLLLQIDSSDDLQTSSGTNIPCIVEKDGLHYDLSSLSKQNFWHYSEPTHNNSDLDFVLSLCKPIKGLESNANCNGTDAVCFMHRTLNNQGMLDTSKYRSIGKIDLNDYKPEVIQEGSLKYFYSNGESCKKDKNINLNYSTELHLQCPFSPNDETPGPILMSSPKCSFVFVWMTLAACPKTVKSVANDTCILKYSNSEDLLNLHSLSSYDFYKPQAIHSSFEINVCSGIINGSCPGNTSVCDTTDPKNPISLAFNDSYNFEWTETSLVMRFGNTYNDSEVEFYLICDRLAISPRIYNMISSESKRYIFKIYTVNVCTPESLNCVVEDKFLNVYDLRPLHKTDRNWEAFGKNANSMMGLFHLNLCGPINSNSLQNPNKCPAGIIGACETSVNSSGAKNLGYITSQPVVNEDRTITVLFTGGDPCRRGAKSSSTRITLSCSKTQYPPILIEISKSCEHIFSWFTPAACPVHEVEGSDCIVTDPLFGQVYDFNPLRNDSHDYRTTDEGKDLIVNVCGPLVSPCNGLKTESVCLTGTHNETSGGKAPGQLVFKDGVIIMKFIEGSPGCIDQKWTSQILFLCSHKEDGPHFMYLDDKCTNHFIWHTQTACAPHTLTDSCSVKEGNLLYDLTPLSDSTINQEYITYYGRNKYVLNVCRSIVHGKKNRCAYDSGSCLIDLTHQNKTKNLGSVTSAGPYLENGRLKLKYENGENCNSTHKYVTIIEFQCSMHPFDLFPTLVAEEKCLFIFNWPTSHACPQSIAESENDTVSEAGNCTAINPQTNYVFDMNELRDIPYNITISQEETFLVTACGKINDQRCFQNNSGACVVYADGTSKSGGKFNNDLKFYMWTTYLEYKSGSVCSNGYERSTKISFICREDKYGNGPVLISDDRESCTYFVNWYTDLACERHINCFAHSWDHMYDLSSLVREWGNYEVTDPENSNQTYLLNVCRPLNPVTGVNCHPGSSSCLVHRHQEPLTLSLGHPILNPAVVGDDRVHLMYSHGSSCPENPAYSLSSKIIFVCNHSVGAGKPEFYQKTHDCQAQFMWHTSLVCPPIPYEGQCQIAYKRAKANVDLSPLMKRGPYKVTYKKKTFLLNLCGESVCQNSGVCLESNLESYGLSATSKLSWQYDTLYLDFDDGARCSPSLTGYRTAQIAFRCDPNAGYGLPEPSEMMDALQCKAYFHWKTNVTCLDSFYKPKNPNWTSTPNPPSISSPSSQIVPPSAKESTSSNHTVVSVTICVFVVMSVVGVALFLFGRSSRGQRLYAHAKRSMTRKGYNAENDTLLSTESAFIYRVDEDEHVLRI